jgi:hypothetical protein
MARTPHGGLRLRGNCRGRVRRQLVARHYVSVVETVRRVEAAKRDASMLRNDACLAAGRSPTTTTGLTGTMLTLGNSGAGAFGDEQLPCGDSRRSLSVVRSRKRPSGCSTVGWDGNRWLSERRPPGSLGFFHRFPDKDVSLSKKPRPSPGAFSCSPSVDSLGHSAIVDGFFRSKSTR